MPRRIWFLNHNVTAASVIMLLVAHISCAPQCRISFRRAKELRVWAVICSPSASCFEISRGTASTNHLVSPVFCLAWAVAPNPVCKAATTTRTNDHVPTTTMFRDPLLSCLVSTMLLIIYRLWWKVAHIMQCRALGGRFDWKSSKLLRWIKFPNSWLIRSGLLARRRNLNCNPFGRLMPRLWPFNRNVIPCNPNEKLVCVIIEYSQHIFFKENGVS